MKKSHLEQKIVFSENQYEKHNNNKDCIQSWTKYLRKTIDFM